MEWVARLVSRRERRGDVVPPLAVDPVATTLLRQLTGDPSSTFRDDQWQVIDALVNRHERMLLIQRTGWGKSAVYFVGASLLRQQGAGPALIVSPLLSLMRNQVEAGRRMGLRIGALHRGTAHRWQTFRDLVRDDRLDVLLVAPERFGEPHFRQEIMPLIASRLGMFVIDEAHCISEWGHDFRLDYQRLAPVIQSLPTDTPVLATTATAHARVVTDIQNQLGDIRIVRGPLIRANLGLQALPVMTASERLAWLVDAIPTLDGQGIIYTLTHQDAELVASWLRAHEVDAQAYHGSIVKDPWPDAVTTRAEIERRFTLGEIRVLVATEALGMGYDNPHVRFVIHFQTPASAISWYQQVGRAGRASESAIGVLMSGPEDAEIHERTRSRLLPTIDEIAWVVAAVRESEPATVDRLAASLNMSERQIDHTLRFLSVQARPLVTRTGDSGREWSTTKALWDTGYGDHRAALIDLREAEWEAMRRYRLPSLSGRSCLMKTLLQELDDPSPIRRCGRCSVCLGRDLVTASIDPHVVERADMFLTHPAGLPIVPRMRVPAGGLSGLGRDGRIPDRLLAREGRVLARFGDRGMGERISAGKTAGKFSPTLVDAAVTAIRDGWCPEPAPTWVTCVPSLRHADLVPDLARSIAAALNVPFVPAVTKVRDVEPQKLQRNDLHQSRNLNGAFQINGDVPSGPVLLVDDMVDSGWTFTIVSILLRRAGSGPVFPFALATTKPKDAS